MCCNSEENEHSILFPHICYLFHLHIKHILNQFVLVFCIRLYVSPSAYIYIKFSIMNVSPCQFPFKFWLKSAVGFSRDSKKITEQTVNSVEQKIRLKTYVLNFRFVSSLHVLGNITLRYIEIKVQLIGIQLSNEGCETAVSFCDDIIRQKESAERNR